MSREDFAKRNGSIDHYVAPFFTGFSIFVGGQTVERLKNERYLDSSAYTAGEIIGSIAFPLLAIYGLDRMISHDDPLFIETMMGTLLSTNVVSCVYEFLREK